MNTRQLRAFVTVCGTGNVSRASQQLHISQPALSRQIMDLEEEFGTSFFTREKHRLHLTEAGIRFLARAQEMLELEARTRTELRNAAGMMAGTVRIGCVESSASEVLADRVADWHARWPDVCFELYAADGDDIRRELDGGRLDFGILLEPVESAKYETVPFPATDRWGVVVPQELFEGRSHVTAADLESVVLSMPRRSIVRESLAEWLGLRPSAAAASFTHNLATNQLLLVRRGAGAMLCVEGAFAIRPAEGLRFLPLHPEKFSGHQIARRRGPHAGRACEAFWNEIAEASA